jgi:hypothetical protein
MVRDDSVVGAVPPGTLMPAVEVSARLRLIPGGDLAFGALDGSLRATVDTAECTPPRISNDDGTKLLR